MRLRRVLMVLGGVALVVGALVLKTLSDAGTFRTLSPHGFSACTRLDINGSEDIVFDATSGLVLVSSTDFRAAMAGEAHAGTVRAIDLTTHVVTVVPHDLAGNFHPHGMAFFRPAEGPLRLFVVNHPTGTSSVVELFDVLDGPRLAHRRTVTSPEFISLNDIAPVGLEQFFVTLDAGTRNGTAARAAETFLRLPWSGLLFFDGTNAKKVAEGMRYSNGVAVVGSTAFVTESSGRRLMAFERSATNELTLLAETDTETALDNITIADDGALWIGAHPKMLEFLKHASDRSHHSPSQLLRATWDAAAKRFEVKEMALDDGSTISASSVVVPLPSGRVLVGSVFEHALDCRL